MLLKENEMLALMKKQDLSKQKLSEILGIGKATADRYLKSKCKVPYRQAQVLVDYFGAEAIADAIDWEAMNASCPI